MTVIVGVLALLTTLAWVFARGYAAGYLDGMVQATGKERR